MQKFQLSVRYKIMGVIFLLSITTVAFGAWMSYRSLQSGAGRGRILKTHFERFRSHLEFAGSGDLAAASLFATDPELVSALSRAEPAARAPTVETTADEPREKAGDKGKVADKDKADGGDKEPRRVSERAHDKRALEAALERLLRSTSMSIDPELVAIVDARGSAIEAPGLTTLAPSVLHQSRLLQDVRSGTVVRSRVALFDNVPYLVAGSRMTSGDDVIGAVLVGRKLQTIFSKYALGSGSTNPEKQHRVSLLKGKDVLASPLPKEEWAAFATEATRTTHAEAREGDATVPILQLSNKDWDFWEAPITGYDGAASPDAELGRLVMIRTRSHKADEFQARFGSIIGQFGVAALLAIGIGLWLALNITRPIGRYIAATEGLATGKADLTQRLDVQADDELGRLAGNLNSVFGQIHDLASRVQKTAFKVGDSSAELSASSRSMLDGAKTQAIKIENSTAAVTELSASIQQIGENASEATRVAHKSGAAAENAIRRLDQIKKTVDQAAARIEALGESGKRIGSIVEVIRHISEQTTLLALNAAIEAAHAGEQGRGFAVVADEVSSLAKRVGRSAKDIEDLIATIRDQTTEAVRAMQVGTREVEEGTHLVTNTLADLKTLIDRIEDTANAVNEQAQASDEIARNMDAVRTIAREVLSASERAVVEGEHLTHLAVELEESVKGFRIEGGRGAETKRAGEGGAPKQLVAKVG